MNITRSHSVFTEVLCSARTAADQRFAKGDLNAQEAIELAGALEELALLLAAATARCRAPDDVDANFLHEVNATVVLRDHLARGDNRNHGHDE
jgi:hypothetical protein